MGHLLNPPAALKSSLNWNRPQLSYPSPPPYAREKRTATESGGDFKPVSFLLFFFLTKSEIKVASIYLISHSLSLCDLMKGEKNARHRLRLCVTVNVSEPLPLRDPRASSTAAPGPDTSQLTRPGRCHSFWQFFLFYFQLKKTKQCNLFAKSCQSRQPPVVKLLFLFLPFFAK